MAKNPDIFNYTINNINTEEVVALNSTVIDLHIRLRNLTHTVQIAIRSGESNTRYITLDNNLPAVSLEDMKMVNAKLYIRSPDIATLEILAVVD